VHGRVLFAAAVGAAAEDEDFVAADVGAAALFQRGTAVVVAVSSDAVMEE